MRLAHSHLQASYAPKAQAQQQRFGANPLDQAGQFIEKNARAVNVATLGTAGAVAAYSIPVIGTTLTGLASGAIGLAGSVPFVGGALGTAAAFLLNPFTVAAAPGVATAAAVNGGVNARYVATQGKNAFGLNFLVGLGAKAKVAAFNTYAGIRNTVSTALGAVAGNRVAHHVVVPQLESEVAKAGAYAVGTVGGGVVGNVVGRTLVSKQTLINLTKGANKNGFFKALAKAFHM
ncbi:MAG: hypothetical protein ACKO37_09930 [Vampirovibrionales bacterium]